LNFPTPYEDFFYYIYAILFSPSYRARYDAYLRQGFPRIPLPPSESLFIGLSDLGHELVAAHLLNLSIHPTLEVSDHPPEAWRVEAVAYNPETCTVFFSSPAPATSNYGQAQFPTGPWIKGITPAMWEFSIGGIPQIAQFLQSRSYSPTRKWNSLQRPLNYDELKELLLICSSIRRTLELLTSLDALFCQIDALD